MRRHAVISQGCPSSYLSLARSAAVRAAAAAHDEDISSVVAVVVVVVAVKRATVLRSWPRAAVTKALIVNPKSNTFCAGWVRLL